MTGVHTCARPIYAVAVIEAVVTLGRRLGLEIVAEGIENEAQAKLMKEVGCTPLQGWFVARPLESSGVGQMLDTSPRVEPIGRMLRGSAEIGRASGWEKVGQYV